MFDLDLYINNKPVPLVYQDEVTVEIEISYGNGVVSDLLVVRNFNKDDDKDLELLEDLLKTLDAMKNCYPLPSMIKPGCYETLSKFNKWFGNKLQMEMESLRPQDKEKLSFSWPNDLFFPEKPGIYKRHSVFYYDKIGRQYEIQVKI